MEIHLDSKLQFLPVRMRFSSSLLLLFQNEWSCKTFSYENKFDLHETWLTNRWDISQWFSTKTRKWLTPGGMLRDLKVHFTIQLVFAWYCRLRHERLKKVPRDMGGPNAYQTLTCFELEDTPPLPNPPSSSSIDDPFDIRIWKNVF